MNGIVIPFVGIKLRDVAVLISTCNPICKTIPKVAQILKMLDDLFALIIDLMIKMVNRAIITKHTINPYSSAITENTKSE
jgi:hypothetical protein